MEIAGFVELPSAQILVLCASYKKKREQNIENIREAMIQQQMTRRFFKAKTREKAINRLKHMDEFGISPWSEADYTGGYWASMVEEIESAAQLGPNVLVAADVAHRLKECE